LTLAINPAKRFENLGVTPEAFMLRFLLPVLALLCATAPALAEPTARASGELAIYAGPGRGYARIGTLHNGAEVHLAECTSGERWCRLRDSGWVDGTYLIGMAAKARAAPLPLLGLDWDEQFWRRHGRSTCDGFPYDRGC
jgi:hypothetical protein